MSPVAALALYPLWAVALLVGLTALRLGRSVGRGLVVLCFALAIWVTNLVLLVSADEPSALASAEIAERVLPLGMLLAAAFIHAGADVAKISDRRAVFVAYAGSVTIALGGAAFPRLLYGPGVRAPGPLFYPLAIASIVGIILSKLHLFTLAHRMVGPARRRGLAIVLGSICAALGGGGAVGLRVLDLAPIEIAAPFLLAAILLATYAVILEERGRNREVLVQALVFAAMTALFSAAGLVVFFRLLPRLAPHNEATWLAFVIFFAALPLDPLRALLVDTIGGWLFARPIAVGQLTQEIEAKETEREQVEGLAELGRLASAVAHEIRNPLGVILAQVRLLERQGGDPESLAEIRGQVERAKRFLEDLLRFAKPRPLALRELDVRGVVGMAASNVRQALAISGDGPFVLDEGAPVFVEADRSAVLDVATVLLHNAAIAVSGRDDGRVTVALHERGRIVEIEVSDNGPGVPKEIEPRLFQLFVTGRGRDDAHPGTGIGLALAARWVGRHGGKIRHERPQAGGARFVVEWPRSPEAPADATSTHPGR